MTNNKNIFVYSQIHDKLNQLEDGQFLESFFRYTFFVFIFKPVNKSNKCFLQLNAMQIFLKCHLADTFTHVLTYSEVLQQRASFWCIKPITF